MEIAAHAPADVEELARTRGLGRSFAEGKLGGRGAGRGGAGQGHAGKPVSRAASRGATLPPGIGPLTDLLRVLLKLRCEENNVAAKLVADSEDLEMIAADDGADVRALARLARRDFRQGRARSETRAARAHRRGQAHQAGAHTPARRGGAVIQTTVT